jgi:hypothetical protein
MEIYRYRIVEETRVFADGSQQIEFKLQAQSGSDPAIWNTLGISPTLMGARKALLFHAPNHGCGVS